MKTVYAVESTKGKIRSNNQDNFYLNGRIKPMIQSEMGLEDESDNPAQVFSVCDGMGGEEEGELAAYIAVETLKGYEPNRFFKQWQTYVQDANDRICRTRNEKNVRMGTTLACVAIEEGRVCAFNVGDSRIYLIRKDSISQLSYDHTEFQSMVDAGVFTREDFSRTTTHNHLTQHLGIHPQEMMLEPFVSEMCRLQEGDLLLLCSDGLYGSVQDEKILSIVQQEGNLKKACRALLDTAERNGSRDNITAMLVQVLPEDWENLQEKTVDMNESPTPSQRSSHNPGPNKEASALEGRKKWAVLALVLVLAAGCGGLFYHSWSHPVVPDVTGKTYEEAQESLEAKGLHTTQVQAYIQSVVRGHVAEQSVAAGQRCQRGEQVTLTVSLGSEAVSVPDVTNKGLEEASSELEELGFEVTVSEEYSERDQEGTVLSQTPKAGSNLNPGSTVKLSISKGSSEVNVPDVVGLSVSKALEKLEAVGLEGRTTEGTSEASNGEEEVLKQDPKAGKKVKRDSEVVLSIQSEVQKPREKAKGNAVVPSLVGMDYQDAYKLLTDLGLVPEYDWTVSDEAYGTVLEQQYQEGKVLPQGSSVFFYVAQESEETADD